MEVHHEFSGALIVDHLRTFDDAASGDGTRRVGAYVESDALVVPVVEVGRGIARHAHPCGVGVFAFVLAIPIVASVVVEHTTSVGIDDAAFGVEPQLARIEFFMLVAFHFLCEDRAHATGKGGQEQCYNHFLHHGICVFGFIILGCCGAESFLSDAKVPTGVGFGACKISQTLVFDEYLAPFGAYKSFAACAIGCIVVTSQAKSFSSL